MNIFLDILHFILVLLSTKYEIFRKLLIFRQPHLNTFLHKKTNEKNLCCKKNTEKLLKNFAAYC